MQSFDPSRNEEEMRAELDTLEEAGEGTKIQQASAKARMARRQTTRLIRRSFKVGDLVLRRADGPRKNTKHGKLAEKWEGPYRIYDEVGKGAYKLQELGGRNIRNTWNARHLKFFYY
jgi:hypothetical protein